MFNALTLEQLLCYVKIKLPKIDKSLKSAYY